MIRVALTVTPSCRGLALAALLTLPAACGGVSFRLAEDVSPPQEVAVLPLGGTADPGARGLARSLLVERLRGRGLRVVETPCVDRVLSEHGWLTDPDRFDPRALPLADVCRALAVDAVLVGHDLGESSFNILLLRRHAFGGMVGLRTGGGSDWWSADYAAAVTGGLLLMSGQLITEIRAQIVHGSPMETLALVDSYVEDVAGTVPSRRSAGTAPPPQLADVRAERTKAPEAGLDRIVVHARAPATASLTFDLDQQLTGVPMAGRAGEFVGARDVPAGSVRTVRVHARGPFGGEPVQAEVVPR